MARIVGLMNFSIGDTVEVFAKYFGKTYNFQSKVIATMPHMDAVIVTWDKGNEVTPYLIAQGLFPSSLEGQKVLIVSPYSNWSDNTGANVWGRITRKVGSTSAKQVHHREPGGMVCMVCMNHIQYASTNMSDGSFCCRNCRATKRYLIPKGIIHIGYVGERN